jgi:hypothetical protein
MFVFYPPNYAVMCTGCSTTNVLNSNDVICLNKSFGEWKIKNATDRTHKDDLIGDNAEEVEFQLKEDERNETTNQEDEGKASSPEVVREMRKLQG